MEKITFRDIQKANDTIKTLPLRGKEYREVFQRVKAFRMLYPNGQITTEIISHENGVVVMKATVTDGGLGVIRTGLRYEKEGSTNVNKTSYIENCETSRVGRALRFRGIGIDMSIASAEEAINATLNQGKSEAKESMNEFCEYCGNLVEPAIAAESKKACQGHVFCCGEHMRAWMKERNRK